MSATRDGSTDDAESEERAVPPESPSATPSPDPSADESPVAPAESVEAPKPGLAVRKVVLLVAVAVIAYLLDQGSKAWVVSALDPGDPHEVVGSLLRLRRTSNPGAAFSIATNATWVLTVVACCVIAATVYVARKLRSRAWACALGLLIGGALGNLTDRFFRSPGGGKGHVVDFLELPHWPIFNVADMSIVSAAVLICILAFIGIGVDGTRVSPDEDVSDDPDSDAASDDAEDSSSTDGDEEPKPRQGSTRL
ncbi:hypothetical protein VV02_17325 [Luteipulveratus mongoliensis]|uniref:Lipoprotein signal peptidase n=1 Tax=Luteipulveratus mongoliensis TaxID=571913 RepID=A0A0K1JQN9_9MICO|nr:hypothetical protein VV02_17325 [Luteipulveratus mongoliensis]